MDKAALLIAAVIAVGVFHTMVPDHWLPIALLARQRGWSRAQSAGAAATAGFGHTLSTLAIAILVWAAGAALAARFAVTVNVLSGIALVAFGAWIAVAAWRERAHGSHEHDHFGHTHVHRHEGGPEHRHWHEHHPGDWHAVDGAIAIHQHAHETSTRTWLLLVLGSSPMVEGIPAFFAASRYGLAFLALLSVLFAVSTIGTYVVTVLASTTGLNRLDLGRFESYGEILSGSLIALVGLIFLFLP